MNKFVDQGFPVPGSKAYQPAFESLRDTSAAAFLDVSQFPRNLLVTADFANTILKSNKSDNLDLYQRAIQFILTESSDGPVEGQKIVTFMMIISPFEAHCLLPKVMRSMNVTLHLYSPRLNMALQPLDGLDLYTVPHRPVMPTLPRNLIIQLNLFAGQLYLNSYQEYEEICEFLGLAYEKTKDADVVAAAAFSSLEMVESDMGPSARSRIVPSNS